VRDYEVMCLFTPELEEEPLKEEIEKLKSFVTDENGEVEKVDVWGKRHLAYPVNKKEEGYYVVVNFKLSPDKITEFKRRLGLLTSVMRFLIVRTGE